MKLAAALARLFDDRPDPGTALVAVAPPRVTIALPALPAPANSEPVPAQPPRADFRNISPRRFAELTHELYIEGLLSWEDFQVLGVPCELHPLYDETIGALTGEKAEPDRPRDMLAEWENRLDFERRFNPGAEGVRQVEHILAVLEGLNQAGPTVQPWLSGPWPEPRPGAASIARRT